MASNQVFRGINNNLAGESHPNARLTSEDIELIFELKDETGMSNRLIADKFECSASTVSDILRGKKRKYGR